MLFLKEYDPEAINVNPAEHMVMGTSKHLVYKVCTQDAIQIIAISF